MARRPVAQTPLTSSLAIGTQGLMQPGVVPRYEIPNLKPSNRIFRKPAEDMFLVQRPWDIQLAALHPVLPGETLMNFQVQARIVSDPIVHKLSGWWSEWYLFYVKHSDLETDWAAIQAMHLTNAALGLADATRRDAYYKSNTTSRVDWGKRVTEAVVKWYFRDGEEPLAGYGNYGRRQPANAGDIFKARVRDPMWLESVKIEDVNPADNADLPGVEGFQDTLVPTAWSSYYDQWEYMRQLKLIPSDATFEDYLKTFGVKAPESQEETLNRPELLRYMRDWTYPTNTVEPTTGIPSSAVSWAVQGRADKPRFFNNPGFLALFHVVRPKVFFGNQSAHATSMLDDAYGWLPAVLHNNPFTSLIEYDNNEGPLDTAFNAADDYWVDRRDLFIRGSQMVNFAPADAITIAPIVDLPKVAGADNDINLWYASDTDAQNLFVDADDSDGKTKIRVDGQARFNIKGHLRDET